MLRLFRHQIALASVLQIVADGVLCFLACLAAGMTQLGAYGASHAEWVGPALVFALLMTGVGASPAALPVVTISNGPAAVTARFGSDGPSFRTAHRAR